MFFMGDEMQILKPLLLCAAWLCSQAWAVNKCTWADGRVVYQDAPCDTKARSTEQVKTWVNTGNTAEDWRFSRQKDSMTGRDVCFVVSPFIYTGYRGTSSSLATVWLQVAIDTSATVALTVRTSEASSNLFHNDISGMGIKVGDKEFTTFNQKVNAHVVSFSDAVTFALLSQMETGSQIRMRLRFWPYDQLHDTPPLSTAGFKQALAQARACAQK